MRHPSRHVGLALCLIIVMLAMTLSACGTDRSGSSASGKKDSATVSGTASSSATASSTTGGTSTSGGSKGLTPAEAKALEDELTAIEAQLNSLGMPSDEDFRGVEDSLE